METTKKRRRCNWCEDDPMLMDYHDHEWGQPLDDDNDLFEALTLEIFQAGLSWKTILHKRENFRTAFDGFEIHKVSEYKEEKIEELLQNKGIVRHRRKIEATIHNANIALELIKDHGSLKNYFDSLPKETLEKQKEIKKTFKHVGLTTAESFLMAAGYIQPDHSEECFKTKNRGNL
ncbi:DNA-3-methyladenine glycosylase I [Pseudalkalibacillus berkeleyi]|uniref:DNA-3-methyladenine glycosylase I n=1 Tax=Pseudalkalibacillus berkeleyi TaxID=1069813 RepID=A0ABS9H336_9BACL|nr:DNA-3-methyladenine glycosylase I [Pseudalkalibacillus berkeleyi]MCF6139369.1 DNA-3-methyladenine glycosylase I [Pseudalkalibacillus berkeleyi]